MTGAKLELPHTDEIREALRLGVLGQLVVDNTPGPHPDFGYPSSPAGLSDYQLQVARGVAHDMSDWEIASQLIEGPAAIVHKRRVTRAVGALRTAFGVHELLGHTQSVASRRLLTRFLYTTGVIVLDEPPSNQPFYPPNMRGASSVFLGLASYGLTAGPIGEVTGVHKDVSTRVNTAAHRMGGAFRTGILGLRPDLCMPPAFLVSGIGALFELDSLNTQALEQA